MHNRFAALAALTVVLALAGCSMVGMTSKTARGRYVAQNPGLSADFRQAILAGEIRIGMTEQDVVAAIGKPIDINRSTYQFGTTAQWVFETWSWSKYHYVYFDNGLVTSWQQ